MCGIAGYLRLDGAPASREILEKMEQSLAHRGPDGAGLYMRRPARLRAPAALDHRSGDRRSADGAARPGPRDHLQRRDLQLPRAARRADLWRGADLSNRERHRGAAGRPRGVGREAVYEIARDVRLAIWETGPKRLTVVRDPLGKKPLQMAFLPGRLFAFASEAKALFALPELSLKDPAGRASRLISTGCTCPSSSRSFATSSGCRQASLPCSRATSSAAISIAAETDRGPARSQSLLRRGLRAGRCGGARGDPDPAARRRSARHFSLRRNRSDAGRVTAAARAGQWSAANLHGRLSRRL